MSEPIKKPDSTAEAKELVVDLTQPEFNTPVNETPTGLVRWYRQLGQNSDISALSSDLIKYASVVSAEVFENHQKLDVASSSRKQRRETHLSGDKDQPLLLDAACMFMEGAIYAKSDKEAEQAFQGAEFCFDSLRKDEKQPSSVRLDAAMYQGDIAFLKIMHSGEKDYSEWLKAQEQALTYLIDTAVSCEKIHDLPVGKFFEGYLIAAMRQRLVPKDQEENLGNTQYLAATLRRDRGHTGDSSLNHDVIKLSRDENGWSEDEIFQLDVGKDKEHLYQLDEVTTVSVEPEEGDTEFVDNMLKYVKAFGLEARYAYETYVHNGTGVLEQLKPKPNTHSTSVKGQSRANQFLSKVT